MAAVSIQEVTNRRTLKQFIGLPWEIYADDPLWVPPIKPIQQRLLTPGKHPFWQRAERKLFLARRGDQVVGRIAAIVNHALNDFQQENGGAWGFFECRRDPEAAMALFAVADDWLRQAGVEFSRGPLNPSTNHEVGLLVEGFDSPPAFMMTYNPTYYLEMIHACGFRKEKDLLSFSFDRDWQPPQWGWEVLKRVEERWQVSVQAPDPKRLNHELRRMNNIYQECWADNWGFVPMSDAELEYSAKDLYFIFDPDFAGFVILDGQPVGVFLMMPDINPLLKRLNGSLGLGALIKRKLYWSEITGLRGLLMGFKKQYQQLGLPAVVVAHVMRTLQKRTQFKQMELGWNLEDNLGINQLYQSDGGALPAKRYRIFRKPL